MQVTCSLGRREVHSVFRKPAKYCICISEQVAAMEIVNATVESDVVYTQAGVCVENLVLYSEI